MSLPVNDSVYDKLLDGYFGETGQSIEVINAAPGAPAVFDDTFRSELWVNYLKGVGLDANDPQLNNILFSTSYLQLRGSPLTPIWTSYLRQNGYPSNYLNSLGAEQSQGSYSWYKFLQSQGLPSNTTTLTPAQQAAFLSFAFNQVIQFQTDFLAFAAAYQASLQEGFVLYLQQALMDSQTQQISLSSSDEIKKRTIMFETFEILLKMLLALQDTVGVVGKNLIFFGKWQEQYTRMLTRVPIYTGGTSSLIKVDNDPDKFTFGYNNISLTDISEWAANIIRNPTGQTESFYINSDVTVTIDIANGPNLETAAALKFTVDPASGAFYVEAKLRIVKAAGIELDHPYDVYSPTFGNSTGTATGLLSTNSFQDNVDAITDTFYSWYNGLPVQTGNMVTLGNAYPTTGSGDVYILFNQLKDKNGQDITNPDLAPDVPHPLNNVPSFRKDTFEFFEYDEWVDNPDNGKLSDINVPWQHTFNNFEGVDADKDKADREAKARGEINARNQQYIENIRSRRQIVQNNAKQIESALSQAKESISQMANLLTSIMDSLKGLISSIFR